MSKPKVDDEKVDPEEGEEMDLEGLEGLEEEEENEDAAPPRQGELAESDISQGAPTLNVASNMTAPSFHEGPPKSPTMSVVPSGATITDPGENPRKSLAVNSEMDGSKHDDLEAHEPVEDDNKEHIINISSLIINTREKAQEIAEIILQVLEEDLYRAKEDGRFKPLKPHLSDPELEKQRRKKWLKDNISNQSLVTNLSDQAFDLGPDSPSEMNLFYEKGDNPYYTRRLRPLKEKSKADKEVQVHITRPPKQGEYLGKKEGFSQTKEFAKLRRQTSLNEYMALYPVPEDWTDPPVPSRTGSLKNILDQVKDNEQREEQGKPGPKPEYKKPMKERLLPPAKGDYLRQDTFWTGSSFKGQYKDRMFELGAYEYPTYASYRSEFKEGKLHSTKHLGIITYPRGDTFEGRWKNGRFYEGQITFSDGLQFDPMGWKYCTPPDRRMHIEYSHGVRGVGETFYSNRLPPPKIPYGCYDVGDGIYDPCTGLVVSYKGILLRKATEYEHEWIVLNCRRTKLLSERYCACFVDGKTPDVYANYIPPNT